MAFFLFDCTHERLATGLLGVLDGCPVGIPSEDGNTYAIQSASVEILVGTTPITPVITSTTLSTCCLILFLAAYGF
ncbi:hypothetical protein PISMIDRAFT_675897 [Pisolithus microcarpus 441]|uniref:Uncharacterized protein n=1 Tax=Pisolithus microcarpus 441 TaxID=765257 RepID=A0A0C9YNG4_9AGAM|nr:hypothetical protein BKA83DRAFT_675897 [Pisolithus microcarpus]KIK26525.1 hypothetical protein PISMIDRAFT_675897 [Pisolithus microcarpus 441]